MRATISAIRRLLLQRIAGRMAGRAMAACLLAHASIACAGDAPGFDRPGFGFDPGTLDPGRFAIEQGLPDVVRDRDDGVVVTSYSTDTLVRLGIAPHVELQFGGSLYDAEHVRGGGTTTRRHGPGDASVGLKVAMPSQREHFAWGLLTTVSLPTGRAPFGGDDRAYDIGAVLQWTLPEDRSLAVHADHGIAPSDSSWLLAAVWSVPLSRRTQVYAEAGAANHGDDHRVIGSGVTWTFADRMQFDLSLRRGLDRASADWQGGFGVAMRFP